MGNYITQISEINTDNIFNNCINLISCDNNNNNNNNNNNKLDTLQPNTIQPDVCSTLPLPSNAPSNVPIETHINAPIETPSNVPIETHSNAPIKKSNDNAPNKTSDDNTVLQSKATNPHNNIKHQSYYDVESVVSYRSSPI